MLKHKKKTTKEKMWAKVQEAKFLNNLKAYYSIILGVALLTSCGQSTETTVFEKPSESIYNIEIYYIDESVDSAGVQNIQLNKKFVKENLYLFFDEGFENDSLFLYVNNKLYSKKKLTTNSSTGNATYLELKNIDTLSSIAFRVNNGRLCFAEVDKEENVIRITFMNNILKVIFDDKVRIYD